MREVHLRIHGLTHASCVAAVKQALQALPAVAHVDLDLHTAVAHLRFAGDDDDDDIRLLLDAVSSCPGKRATLIRAHPHPAVTPTRGRAVTLQVEGITCMACVVRVEQALHGVRLVSDVDVQLESGIVTLLFAGEDVQLLVRAIEQGAQKQAQVIDQPIVDPPSSSSSSSSSHPASITLRVEGMTCMGCVSRVTDALNAVEGTDDVDVALETGLATLNFAHHDPALLIDAISKHAGKSASVVVHPPPPPSPPPLPTRRKVTLRVDGMSCMGCVGRVKDALTALDTASDVVVSLQEGRATLTYAGEDETLINAVADGADKVAAVLHDADQIDPMQPLHPVDLSSPAHVVPEAVVEVDDTLPDVLIDSGSVDEFARPESMVTTQLRVGGMTCSSCVGVVEGVLLKIEGVSTAKVNLLAGRATIVHDTKLTVAQTLASAVASSGYDCKVLETGSEKSQSNEGDDSERCRFRIDFPTDVQAQNALKKLRFLDGVDPVEVKGCTASVTLVNGFRKSQLLRMLESDGGFGKMILRRSLRAEQAAEARGDNLGATDVIDEEAKLWRKRFFMSLSFMVPIMLIGFVQSLTKVFGMHFVQWAHFFLATPVQFICGSGFYRASYFALKKRRATMDVLVSLSTSIAYFSSVVVLLFGLGGGKSGTLGHSTMFNVSAMIITMVLVGKWLEATAKRRAAAGVAALSALTPEAAVLYDEKEAVSCHTEVPVNVLDVGDIVRLIPGDRVPTDGEVIDGMSAVDESMLTGESNPVPKKKGDFVYGGTVNGGGSMLVRTSAVGSDAVLSQIVKLVNDAQTARAPIEAFADKVSAVFVPAVVSFSFLVFLGWYSAAIFNWIPRDWWAEEGRFFFALLFALETMVIACPCALGLATPTAVMVASEVGTRLGVLFRGGGAALEAANNVRTVLFDKTGTLTMGKPEVAAVLVGEHGSSAVEQASVVLSDLIYLVESESHHPLASAITRYLRERSADQPAASCAGYKISQLEELPGRGVQAIVNKGEYTVKVGSRAWAFGEDGALEKQLLSEKELAQVARMESEDGLTVVAAVVNDSLVAVYGLEDTVRPEAESVVRYLRSKLSVECHIVTGDSEETGRAVAQKVGIPTDNLRSRAMPWTKVDAVKSLPSGTGCFIGDGINDAPALAASSLGIAIGAGAPVAAESAAVVLVRSDLRGVAHALALARATFRRVRINFVWAIAYNVLGIPVAAGLLYPMFGIRVPPLLASGAMAVSSTSVVISSLALRWFEAPKLDAGVVSQGIEHDGAIGEKRSFSIGDEEPGMHSLDASWQSVDAPLLDGEIV